MQQKKMMMIQKKMSYKATLVGKTMILALLCLIYTKADAQQGGRGREKIEHARQQFIKNRLRLTADQEGKFWPVYQEHQVKKKEIFSKLRQARQQFGKDSTSEEALKKDLKEIMQRKKEQLNEEEMYQNKLLTVLSAKQVVQLYLAEKEFLKMLRKKAQSKN